MIHAARLTGLILCLVLINGCGVGTGTGHHPVASDGGVFDDGGASAANANLSGDWSFTGAHNDPPRYVECTGQLTQQTLCGYFGASIEQQDAVFAASEVDQFCSNYFEIAGTVAGETIAGTITATTTSTVVRTTFNGVVEGANANLYPIRMSVDGIDGSCSLSGTFVGSR